MSSRKMRLKFEISNDMWEEVGGLIIPNSWDLGLKDWSLLYYSVSNNECEYYLHSKSLNILRDTFSYN